MHVIINRLSHFHIQNEFVYTENYINYTKKQSQKHKNRQNGPLLWDILKYCISHYLVPKLH